MTILTINLVLTVSFIFVIVNARFLLYKLSETMKL